MAVVYAKFTAGGVGRHILVMTSTSALSLLAVFLVDILTLVYVSMLHDPRLLAAVGIAKVFIFFNSAIASGVIIAAASVLSERIGDRKADTFARLTLNLLVMVTIASGLTAGLQLVLVNPITHWLGADNFTYPLAHGFILLSLPFIVLQSLMQMCAQILRAIGESRLALWVVLTGAATLALADPLFIFVFDLGLDGAGIAYAVSGVVSATLGVYLVWRCIGLPRTFDMRLFRVHASKTLKIAFPATVGNLATPVGVAYLVSSLSTYGTFALAAMAVLDRVIQVSYCPFFSLPSALAPVLGQNIGAHRNDRVNFSIDFTRRLVVVYGLTVWGLLILSSGTMADIFALEGEGRALFLTFCHYGAGLWIFVGLDFVAISVFITMGRPWLVAIFGWLRATVGTVPFVLVGTHLFGSSGALPGMFTGTALIAIISIITASRTAKRFLKTRHQAAQISTS
ncbi:Na+-driven multidrug efflux pump [Pseudomonas fluorescens]|uniref:MATE family efflux transporter n=1 Tax=Pseudomonas fluorescens TaxID=294 RepID=UPI00209E0015|nr:MATE family efflux transporter [Pseudomonas fluorescens]MCP1484644.1 Na+-driven multidrug efflux pump [Pseudomonas fluorescens]